MKDLLILPRQLSQKFLMHVVRLSSGHQTSVHRPANTTCPPTFLKIRIVRSVRCRKPREQGAKQCLKTNAWTPKAVGELITADQQMWNPDSGIQSLTSKTNSLASQRIVYKTAPCTLFGQVSNMNGLQAFQSTMKELRTTSRASNHVAGKPHGGCTEKPIPQQGLKTMRMTHISTDQWFYVHLRRRETFRIQVR